MVKKEKKVIRSLAELAGSGLLVFEPEIIKMDPKEKKEKIKKEKALYEQSDIQWKGSQLRTHDNMYETYSVGAYSSWRLTMLGQKNGATDIGNDIADGYPHSSFHDRSRAATILCELIICKTKV